MNFPHDHHLNSHPALPCRYLAYLPIAITLDQMLDTWPCCYWHQTPRCSFCCNTIATLTDRAELPLPSPTRGSCEGGCLAPPSVCPLDFPGGERASSASSLYVENSGKCQDRAQQRSKLFPCRTLHEPSHQMLPLLQHIVVFCFWRESQQSPVSSPNSVVNHLVALSHKTARANCCF